MNITTIKQVLFILIIAHLLSDFVLQPDKLQNNKGRWYWILLHSGIHAVIAYLLLAEWNLWYLALLLGFTHFWIDFFKIKYNAHLKDLPKRDTAQRLFWIFIVDQIIHLLIILCAAFWVAAVSPTTPFWFSWMAPYSWKAMTVIAALILLIPCGGIFIKMLMEPLHAQMESSIGGFEEGGKLIGYLERVLIFVFILFGQFSAVGFLVTAKSIFRFSEIKESKDRKEVEYIIIGTLASFLFAITISLLTKAVLN